MLSVLSTLGFRFFDTMTFVGYSEEPEWHCHTVAWRQKYAGHYEKRHMQCLVGMSSANMNDWLPSVFRN